MKVPLLDLKKQYQQIKDEIIPATQEVFESQMFILGPKVEEFEKKAAEYCHSQYALGVSSGTDAILIALMAAGIGPGDRVITTPYTFFATAGCICRLGASPVFVDIHEETYNIDPDKLGDVLASINEKERPKLKAILPVHLYGQCADMEPIIELSKKYDLAVIEDAAQAIGSEYRLRNGSIKRAGSLGQYGCFSFFPSKNLGAFGDAGLVTTNDKNFYDKLKILRVHGAKPKYYHQYVGGNFRIDALQAVILSIKLKYLEQWTNKRIENAECYRHYFNQAGIHEVTLPAAKEKRHIYNQFVIRVKDKRDELKAFLNEHEIGTEIYYPVPLHIQECFKYLNYKENDFPISERAAKSTLALPIYPELLPTQIEYIVDIVSKFFKKN
ncbi:MAG: DegT/DnrJ/EryC1/StrS family aminotransferase [Desulfobacteraceae bacterium]|nr:MAG: DegT/DnrJ/EryC1/StrS family aminotransferase [Desulfobacteraceae bacterium]